MHVLGPTRQIRVPAQGRGRRPRGTGIHHPAPYLACVPSSRRLAVLVDQATEPVETTSAGAMDGASRRKFRRWVGCRNVASPPLSQRSVDYLGEVRDS